MHCSVIKISSIYETKPFGNIEQDNFLNAVLNIETMYTPTELFIFLKQFEKKLGRNGSIRWGPREIDLDILFYNDLIYSDENITIPHKGITDRDFVLVPLTEIEPELIHPLIGIPISEINTGELKTNIINKLPIDLPYKWKKKDLTPI